MNTMDHNPDRMNVHVDKEGIVKQIKWGSILDMMTANDLRTTTAD